MRSKIILDVAAGGGKIPAVLAALRASELDVLGICTVAGRETVCAATGQISKLLRKEGRKVPVYRGCAEPLAKGLCPNRLPLDGYAPVDERENAEALAEDMLDSRTLPAAMFYVDCLRRAEAPVTLLMLGPLTNLAVALLLDPSIVGKIEKILIAGGGDYVTDATPAAEWNVWLDPEAAQRVLRSEARVIMVSLDAARAVNGWTLPDGGAVAETSLTGLLAVCAAMDEGVLSDVRHVHCDVGFGDVCEGETLIDRRYHPEKKNCYFAYAGNQARLQERLSGLLDR